jgi:hypothetical protein
MATVGLLLERNANVEHHDNEGRTALGYALDEMATDVTLHEIVYVLLQATAQKSSLSLVRQLLQLPE